MEGYSTIEQVATHYQVSISTVRSWVREKIIPFIKVGGMYRFRMSEVDVAFLSRTIRGTPPVTPENDVASDMFLYADHQTVRNQTQILMGVAEPEPENAKKTVTVLNPDQDA